MRKIFYLGLVLLFILSAFPAASSAGYGGGDDHGKGFHGKHHGKHPKTTFQTARATRGSVHGTTKIVVTQLDDSYHLAVNVSNTRQEALQVGDEVPTTGTFTDPYIPGTNISGVDERVNQFVELYKVDASNHVVAAKVIQLRKNDIAPEKWKLIWDDEFNERKIDTSKWNFIEGGGGYGNNELQNYTSRKKNARIEDGHLVIEAHKEQYQGNDYTSAKLTTEGKGDWTYGRFEIRAKLPEGQGIWPAIWMMPTDYQLYGTWPSSGEIDIMELLGDDPDTVYGTLHFGNPHSQAGAPYSLEEGSFTDSYHTFAIEWEPGEFRWYIDGKLYQKQNRWFSKLSGAKAPFTYPAPFDRNFYLQLNVAVGGNWPGNPDETTQFPQQMLVDYVKVYKLNNGKYRDAGSRPEPSPYAIDTSDAREPLPDGNYIYNGGFDNGTKNWTFDPFEPEDKFGGLGSMAVDNGALKISVDKPGNAVHAVQVIQHHLYLQQGKTYKLSFDAHSNTNRTMAININGGPTSYTRFLQNKTVSLTTDKKHYTFTFKMNHPTSADARLELNLGAVSSAPVWVDNVRLEEIQPDPNAPRNPLANGNLVYNGTFDKGPGGLIYWDVATDHGGDAKASVGNAIANRKLNVSIHKGGKTTDAVQVLQNNLYLQKGKTYLVSFEAKTNSKRSIEVNLTSQDGSVSYSGAKTIKLGKDMSTHRFVFVMENDTDPNAQLQFNLGMDNKDVALDNVYIGELTPPIIVNGSSVIQAENFSAMSGVRPAGGVVGYIGAEDWMQYAVDVKQAGDYKIAYRVASDLDSGKIITDIADGSVYTLDFGKGKLSDDLIDREYSIDISRTGGWNAYTTYTDTIHLDQGVQTIQIMAPDVNVDCFSLTPVSGDKKLIKNGSFTDGMSSWNHYNSNWNGVAASTTTSIENGQLKVSTGYEGEAFWHIQEYQGPIPLVAGKNYTLKFDERSTVPRDIKVDIEQSDNVNNKYIFETVHLGTEMKTYTITFTMQDDVDNIGKLILALGKTGPDYQTKGQHTMYFDNVSLTIE
ncbi:MAG TPA: carbohydrate binding domain-containing protein [Bacillales bacterium]